jgi:hypothetical protein
MTTDISDWLPEGAPAGELSEAQKQELAETTGSAQGPY